jgi:hypothetical protein
MAFQFIDHNNLVISFCLRDILGGRATDEWPVIPSSLYHAIYSSAYKIIVLTGHPVLNAKLAGSLEGSVLP